MAFVVNRKGQRTIQSEQRIRGVFCNLLRIWPKITSRFRRTADFSPLYRILATAKPDRRQTAAMLTTYPPAAIMSGMNRKGLGFLILISLPFAGVGVWVALSLAASIHTYLRMQKWIQVPAQILKVDLVVGEDDDGDPTYHTTADTNTSTRNQLTAARPSAWRVTDTNLRGIEAAPAEQYAVPLFSESGPSRGLDPPSRPSLGHCLLQDDLHRCRWRSRLRYPCRRHSGF